MHTWYGIYSSDVQLVTVRRADEARAGAGDVMPESATAASFSAGAIVSVDSAGVAADPAVPPSSITCTVILRYKHAKA